MEAAAADLPPALVSNALSLAAELGASEIQTALLRSVVGQPAGPNWQALSGMEELQRFLEERSREYRERFGEWLSGRMPAATALPADLKTFARLFLADATERKNDVGAHFAMLLRSGRLRTPAQPVSDARRTLRIDVSGLLLAHRLDILAEVDTAFAIEVPPSLPEALHELESAFRAPQVAIVDELERALDPSRSALRFETHAPSGALTLEKHDAPGELDGAVLEAILERAFLEGHLGEADRQRVRLETEASERLTTPCDAVVLSPCALYRLAAAGILQAAARGTALFLSTTDADACRRDLRTWVHDAGLAKTLARLRETTAERLARNRWTTIGQTALSGLNEQKQQTPAHVRSLLEVVAAQGAEPALFWIEDRFLSHGRFEGGLDVLDVLDTLHARGLVTEQRRASLERRLRDIGHAFMPIDPEAIMAAIASARIGERGLIETEDMADMRRWFAMEVDCLAHVDANMTCDEEGAVISEARRLIEVGGLARTLLAKVWTSTKSSRASKLAQSNWIWTILRIGPIPRGAVPDPKVFLELAAAIAAHTLDIPLLGGMGGEGKMSAEAEQGLVDWFVAVELEPLAEANPDAGAAVANHLASIAARLLDSPTGSDPEQETWLRRVFAGRVVRLLELLPPDWCDLVLDRSDLRARLGMRKVVSYSLGEGASCTAAAVSQAYAEALDARGPQSDGPVEVQIDLIGGSTATLRLGPAATDLPVVFVGQRTGGFDAATSALLDRDKARRVDAFVRADDLLTQTGSIRRTDLEDIAVIEDLDERLNAYEDLLVADLDRRLRRLRETLMERRPSVA